MIASSQQAHVSVRRILRRLLVAVLPLALLACGSTGGEEASPDATADPSLVDTAATSQARPVEFVGTVASTGAYLSVVTTPDGAIAYLCDGAEVASWFSGPLNDDGSFALTSAAGDAVGVELGAGGDTATATVGTERVELIEVAAPSGLYTLSADNGEEVLNEYLAGWIVLPDGSQKGAIKQGANVVSNAPVDASAGTAPLPSGGSGTAVPVSGFGGCPGGFNSFGCGGGGGFQGGFGGFGGFGGQGGFQGGFGGFGGGQGGLQGGGLSG